MNDPLIGQTLNRYEILALLGGGGMGSVYRGRDITLQRDVAIKMMHPQFSREEVFKERFLQEARAAARFDHPGIVKVYDFGQYQSQLYIVLEFVPGVSLGKKIAELRAKQQWLALDEGLEIMRQVCLSVDYLHKHGALHRDLKPDNILLRPEPSGSLPYRPVIVDLGLAKLAEGSQMTTEGTAMGTPAYMSPEQALGDKVDARTDIYALGVMLFELAAGRLPFQVQGLTQAIQAHTKQPPPSPRSLRPNISTELEQVILKALAKAPADRYQTALDLALAIQGAAEGTGAAPARTEVNDLPLPGGQQETRIQIDPVEVRGPSVIEGFSPPSKPGGVIVQVLSPGGKTQSYPIKPPSMTVGRDSSCDIVLGDSKASRRHVRIDFDGVSCTLSDLGSANGTYLDNQRLLPGLSEAWSPEKALRIGDTWLRLVGSGAPAQTGVGGGWASTSAGAGSSRAVAGPAGAQSSVGLALDSREFRIDPGAAGAVALTLINQGSLVDHVEAALDGIPPEWISSPRQEVQLMPGAESRLQFVISPPRSPQARAGTYAFTVRARSLDAPGQQAETSGSLVITPYAQFSTRLQPERVRAGATARVIITNQGNSADTFAVQWQDRAEAVAFRPPAARIPVPEGGTAVAEFVPVPVSRSLVGGETILPFTAQVAGSQGAAQQVLSGEVAGKAWLPLWIIPVMIALMLCLFAGVGGAFAFRGQLFGAAPSATPFAQPTLAAGIVDPTNAPSAEPTLGPTETAPVEGEPTATLEPSATVAPTETAPAVQPPLISLVHPVEGENMTVTNRVVEFEATASDPATGANNGDGIQSVDFEVVGPAGQVFQKTENNAPYCAFGQDDQNRCRPLAFYSTGNRWPNGTPIDDGTYTFKVTARALDGRTASAESKVQINVLPWIMFEIDQSGSQQVAVTNLDGSVQVQLTSDTALHHYRPAYRPNGGRVLYISASTNGNDIVNNNDIYSMRADGTDVKRLTNRTASHLYASWSPDGKRILYTVNDESGRRDVYIMDENGENVRNLTSSLTNIVTNAPAYNTQPSWSPDGSRVTFRSDASGRGEVWIVDDDGSNLTQLTFLDSNLFDPMFSPDGQQILFYSDKANAYGVYTVTPDGSNVVNLSANQFDNTPFWSPDGSQIVFTMFDGTTSTIWVMNADGSNRRQLTSSGSGAPSWSPDGEKIAYLAFAGTGEASLWVMNADGSNPVQLAQKVFSAQPMWHP